MTKKSEFILPEELLEDSRVKKAKIIAWGKKKEVHLTEKQEKLAVIMAADPTKPFHEMKVEAGFSKKFPSNLVKKQIAGKLGTTLAENGVFECDIGRAIAEGLLANRYITVRTNKREEKTGKILGEEIQLVAIPDHRVRQGYIKIACLLGGYFAPKKIDLNVSDDRTRKVMAVLGKVDPDKLEQDIMRDREDGVEAEFEILEETA